MEFIFITLLFFKEHYQNILNKSYEPNYQQSANIISQFKPYTQTQYLTIILQVTKSIHAKLPFNQSYPSSEKTQAFRKGNYSKFSKADS